jgi:hypothetical protein
MYIVVVSTLFVGGLISHLPYLCLFVQYIVVVSTLFVGGLMSHLPYLCLFVQYIVLYNTYCVVLSVCFLCLRLVFCIPSVDTFSRLSILNCSLRFSLTFIDSVITMFLLNFGTVPTEGYILFFHFYSRFISRILIITVMNPKEHDFLWNVGSYNESDCLSTYVIIL